MYPNEENMIVMPITKIIEIITRIQVWLISRANLFTRKMVERKAFLANPKHQYLYRNEEEMIAVHITKKWRLL